MIRTAAPGDEREVRACAEEAYAQYVAAIGRKPAPMVADFARQIATGCVHVACGDDGAVEGFIVFFRREGRMFLENVAVRPSAQGKGLGKALIGFCEAAARRQGLGAVELYTNEKMTANLSMYPALGYREVDRRREDGFNRVYFRKALGTS